MSSVNDLMVHDGLTCSFTGVHMGTYGNRAAEEMEISREDRMSGHFEVTSGQLRPSKAGIFAEEIVPVEVPQRKGAPLLIEHDESPRKDTSLEQLAEISTCL